MMNTEMMLLVMPSLKLSTRMCQTPYSVLNGIWQAMQNHLFVLLLTNYDRICQDLVENKYFYRQRNIYTILIFSDLHTKTEQRIPAQREVLLFASSEQGYVGLFILFLKVKESLYKSYDELTLFLNTAMVAKVLGVSPSIGYELMHEKGFPILKIGNRMVVPKEQFIQWVIEHTERGHRMGQTGRLSAKPPAKVKAHLLQNDVGVGTESRKSADTSSQFVIHPPSQG